MKGVHMKKKTLFINALLLPAFIGAYTDEQMEEMIEAGQEAALYAYLNQSPVVVKPRPKKKNDKQMAPAVSVVTQEAQVSIEQPTAVSSEPQLNELDDLVLDEIPSDSIELSEEPETEVLAEEEQAANDGIVEADESADETVSAAELQPPYGIYQSIIEEFDAYMSDGKVKSLKKASAILKQLAQTFKEDAEFIESNQDLYTALVSKDLYPISGIKKEYKRIQNHIKKLETKPGILAWLRSWFSKPTGN